ncbi:hypothetical protein ACU70A_06505 [Syntrophomonas erecta subsp. sporosyntropha]
MTNIGKGARIRNQREEGTDRRNTLVTKETGPARMANPANAGKARRSQKEKARIKAD